MLVFFSFISFIFCVAVTIYAYKEEIASVLIINIVAFLVIGTMLGCNSSTFSICVCIIATGIINAITLYILSEIQNVKNYEYNNDGELVSKIQIEYIKKIFKIKLVIVGFVVISLILLPAFCYTNFKFSDSKSLVGKYKNEIKTYKTEIEEKNDQISTLENRVEAREAIISILESQKNDLKSEIKMYEKATRNTKGFVFVTETGTKFHLEDCHHLAKSSYFIMYTKAINAGYTPCSNCLPNGY